MAVVTAIRGRVMLPWTPVWLQSFPRMGSLRAVDGHRLQRSGKQARRALLSHLFGHDLSLLVPWRAVAVAGVPLVGARTSDAARDASHGGWRFGSRLEHRRNRRVIGLE